MSIREIDSVDQLQSTSLLRLTCTYLPSCFIRLLFHSGHRSLPWITNKMTWISRKSGGFCKCIRLLNYKWCFHGYRCHWFQCADVNRWDCFTRDCSFRGYSIVPMFRWILQGHIVLPKTRKTPAKWEQLHRSMHLAHESCKGEPHFWHNAITYYIQ